MKIAPILVTVGLTLGAIIGTLKGFTFFEDWVVAKTRTEIQLQIGERLGRIETKLEQNLEQTRQIARRLNRGRKK